MVRGLSFLVSKVHSEVGGILNICYITEFRVLGRVGMGGGGGFSLVRCYIVSRSPHAVRAWLATALVLCWMYF